MFQDSENDDEMSLKDHIKFNMEKEGWYDLSQRIAYVPDEVINVLAGMPVDRELIIMCLNKYGF